MKLVDWRMVVLTLIALPSLVLAQETPPDDQAEQPALVSPGIQPLEPVSEDSAGDLNMGAPELIFQQQDSPDLVAPDASSFQFYITDLENREGPYSAGLSEQLLGLGTVYQEQGLHQEAINAFKRGIHIARVNTGLYGQEQIPLLQRMIRSLVATGDYETADERQYYMYRVQRKVFGDNSEQMSAAMLQRAAWERQAYYLALGDTAFTRLLAMWELYGTAISSIARREGSQSTSLLQPLMGLLQTQYMISSYSGEGSSMPVAGNSADPKFVEQNRFGMVRVSNYKQGQAVITAMREVYDYNEGENSPASAETWLKLGDWHLWHGKRDSAAAAYQSAWDHLAELENSEEALAQAFGQPTLLPAMPGSPRDLSPPAEISGYAEVSYYISPRGRVKDLELVKMEPADETDQREPVRLLRTIKRMVYRPQMVDREPVATETITKRYAY